MTTSVKQMLADANAAVPKITPQDARALVGKENVLVVDVATARKCKTPAKSRARIHVPRGMIEFRADPESPYYDKKFSRDKTVLVYCASGGRSALSGKTLKDLGYKDVRNLGGFKIGPRAAARPDVLALPPPPTVMTRLP